MSLFDTLDLAGSALSAQSVRLNVVSSNLANADAVTSSVDTVYRARKPVFQSILAESFDAPGGTALGGVRVAGVVESEAPLRREHRPGHPAADADGYIVRPNVNPIEELADMIAASRSFESNVEVINTSKQLLLRTLSLGQ